MPRSFTPISLAPVLVFDSGMGGLSIVQSLRHACPQLEINYVADNAACPYGLKDDAWLIERILSVLHTCLAQAPASALVLACNTASTLVLEQLRAVLAVPIIGVVPAIKPAAQISQNRCFALLATPATIRRPYTDALIASFAADCEVVRLGAADLVPLAEAKLAGHPIKPQALMQSLQPLLLHPHLDTVVLGCTHFPLLLSELSSLAPHWQWVDSGAAVARRTLEVLALHYTYPQIPMQKGGHVWFTDTQSGQARAQLAACSQAYALHLHHHLIPEVTLDSLESSF
ncbi:glutamate racemase [Allopseudospirillum japonicum]|uniref:Glutamate racemase n=1 Tax=Allopseudospirillum japonicum TaxID=64971 RepID=A0A1H6RTZ0_9GAMM|nr:glutamate racemase [Allopseudospirillum japonicum]SEI56934.1 glutamate racemase [Allopseudospirillum japonicum]